MDLIEKKSDLFLVTTALEKTWPKGSRILFLGEWCRLYHRKESWQRLHSQLLPFHLDDRKKLNSDFHYLQEFNKLLLGELVGVLNQIHNTNHNKTYWRLLIGYWINIYTATLYDRWYSIKEASKNIYGLKTLCYPIDHELLAAQDTGHFIDLAGSNDYWNHMVYSLCISESSAISEIKLNDLEDLEILEKTIFRRPLDLLMKTKQSLSKGLWFLKRNNDVVVFNSSLSRRDSVLLNAKFKQLPSIFDDLGQSLDADFSCTFRAWNLNSSDERDGFKQFARSHIAKFLPRLFLEGFGSSKKEVEKNNLPASPKVIFTSVSHYNDDMFKLWAAARVSEGTKLVIGQHGGGSPCKFNGSTEYELSIADRFLSSGWSDEGNKHIRPVGNFRISCKSSNSVFNPKGGLLIACGQMPQYVFDLRSMALGPQFKNNFEDVFELVSMLDERIKQRLLVRLHPSDENWHAKYRWLDHHPSTEFDNSSNSIANAMRNQRLFIGTYRSTTYIDSLATNTPTIMFWNPNFWEVSSETEPFFEKLKDAGIWHDNSDSAAKKIAEIWEDIPGWWMSDKVQTARNNFVDNFCWDAPGSITRIKNELLSIQYQRS